MYLPPRPTDPAYEPSSRRYPPSKRRSRSPEFSSTPVRLDNGNGRERARDGRRRSRTPESRSGLRESRPQSSSSSRREDTPEPGQIVSRAPHHEPKEDQRLYRTAPSASSSNAVPVPSNRYQSIATTKDVVMKPPAVQSVPSDDSARRGSGASSRRGADGRHEESSTRAQGGGNAGTADALEDFIRSIHSILLLQTAHSLHTAHLTRLRTFPSPSQTQLAEAQTRVKEAERRLESHKQDMATTLERLLHREFTSDTSVASLPTNMTTMEGRLRTLEEGTRKHPRPPSPSSPGPDLRPIAAPSDVNEEGRISDKRSRMRDLLEDLVRRVEGFESEKKGYEQRLEDMEHQLSLSQGEAIDEIRSWADLERVRGPKRKRGKKWELNAVNSVDEGPEVRNAKAGIKASSAFEAHAAGAGGMGVAEDGLEVTEGRKDAMEVDKAEAKQAGEDIKGDNQDREGDEAEEEEEEWGVLERERDPSRRLETPKLAAQQSSKAAEVVRGKASEFDGEEGDLTTPGLEEVKRELLDLKGLLNGSGAFGPRISTAALHEELKQLRADLEEMRALPSVAELRQEVQAMRAEKDEGELKMIMEEVEDLKAMLRGRNGMIQAVGVTVDDELKGLKEDVQELKKLVGGEQVGRAIEMLRRNLPELIREEIVRKAREIKEKQSPVLPLQTNGSAAPSGTAHNSTSAYSVAFPPNGTAPPFLSQQARPLTSTFSFAGLMDAQRTTVPLSYTPGMTKSTSHPLDGSAVQSPPSLSAGAGTGPGFRAQSVPVPAIPPPSGFRLAQPVVPSSTWTLASSKVSHPQDLGQGQKQASGTGQAQAQLVGQWNPAPTTHWDTNMLGTGSVPATPELGGGGGQEGAGGGGGGGLASRIGAATPAAGNGDNGGMNRFHPPSLQARMGPSPTAVSRSEAASGLTLQDRLGGIGQRRGDEVGFGVADDQGQGIDLVNDWGPMEEAAIPLQARLSLSGGQRVGMGSEGE